MAVDISCAPAIRCCRGGASWRKVSASGAPGRASPAALTAYTANLQVTTLETHVGVGKPFATVHPFWRTRTARASSKASRRPRWLTSPTPMCVGVISYWPHLRCRAPAVANGSPALDESTEKFLLFRASVSE